MNTESLQASNWFDPKLAKDLISKQNVVIADLKEKLKTAGFKTEIDLVNQFALLAAEHALPITISKRLDIMSPEECATWCYRFARQAVNESTIK